MVPRDFVPMRDRIAGPRATGKPLQVAVDDAPGTTAATASFLPPRAGAARLPLFARTNDYFVGSVVVPWRAFRRSSRPVRRS
jgi:hypothetical protein